VENLLAGKSITGPETGRLLIDDRSYVNFVGFNYLALQGAPELREAAMRALQLGQPWSQMGSSGYGGVDIALDDVARAGADYFGSETAVYMATGYFCGPVATESVRNQYDIVYLDELAHFNLLDAAKISGKPFVVFPHRDADTLAKLVKSSSGKRPLVMRDGVFATTGAIAPLQDYCQIVDGPGGVVVVDESHAYGVVGRRGRGAAEHCESAVVQAGTLSKAFCAHGALFPCSEAAAAAVRRAPPLRGASSGSMISAMVCASAMRIAMQQPERRERVARLAQRLKCGLRAQGLNIIETPAPITSFRLETRNRMLELQRRLFDEGMHVLVSNYIGSGPEGMIRCATFADHTEADVDQLVSAIGRLV
jgi:7-keto-8-aminopelargonate synthetase-like enzyme